MRGSDPAAQLMRALTRRADGAALLTHDGLIAWSSATFVGGQHRVSVVGPIDWLHGLEEADLPMRGCFAAGIEVRRTPAGAVLTVLVLDE